MKRALLSVFDKTNLTELGKGLSDLGYELVASGGTAKALRLAGLSVTPISSITGHPEILDGRVKTLHPVVHGGILARRTDRHLLELADHGIAPIDVVACNLYPFVQTVASGASEAETVEQIDIGGVTLLRAAAKNFESVVVLCDPADYERALSGLADASTDVTARRKLALAAFRHTASYDAAIANWLMGAASPDDATPAALHLSAERVASLRYGENPHQAAAVYRWTDAPAAFEFVRGAKELSYNNIVDLEAAWAMVTEFGQPAVAIIKHTNPCGLAVGETTVDAFAKALASDPVSAFGSVIACNRPVDAAFIDAWGKLFVEVLIAPEIDEKALQILGKRKKNCRVMRASGSAGPQHMLRNTSDGLLLQTADDRGVHEATWQVVTDREPTATERADLAFAWLVCKHVKSNAIVFANGGATVGVGPGQPNRVESVRIAARNAGERSQGAVAASDAFFPFADGLEAAAEAGVTAVIQPGGSIRDSDVIAAANRLGVAMICTGERHFLH